MKKIVLFVAVSVFFTALTVQAQKEEKASKDKKEKKAEAPKKHKELKTEIDSVSYSLGLAIGNTIKTGGLENVNQKMFDKAFQQVLADEETWISKDSIQSIITNYLMKLEKQKSEKNIAEGKKFLEENKKKPGVIALPSGLQYKVIKEGTGPKPTAADKVTVHYHGTLSNGKVFDSSIDRGEPIQLGVGQVIKGWTEALQLMPTGSKWVLYIPSELGYGDRSMPGSIIEPNSVLVFEVELISIDKPEPQQMPEMLQPQYQDMLNK